MTSRESPQLEREPASASQVPDDRVDVLCIGGTGQNGATLLCRMLGRLPGFIPVGELGYLWDKGLIENVECGCGRPFRECPFWTAVGDAAFGGWDAVDPYEALRLRGAVKLKGRPHPLSLLFILAPRLWPSFGADLRRYSELMERLYAGIRSAAGGGIVVDSMKRPSHVYMMRSMPALDLTLVHQVRDSRGVAYSSLKYVERQGTGKGPLRARRSPPKAAGRWMWINLSFELLSRLGVRSTRVRYESLVRRPRLELARIAELAGVPVADGDLDFLQGADADLGIAHLVAGNRMRLQRGTVRLRTDEEWRRALTPRQRRIVSALTWPLLVTYGYVNAHRDGERRP